MKKFLTIRNIIYGLVLALVGNALWEGVFRKTLNFIWKYLLTISTLGIDKYKNNLYIDIARGFYEQASLEILTLFIGLVFGIFFGGLLSISSIKKSDDTHEKEGRLFSWYKRNKSIVKSVMVIYVIFMLAISTLTIARIAYVNKSIAYYQQLQSIVHPYITDEQVNQLNSRFAQIKNQSDYIKLIEDIISIANTNNLALPNSPSFIF